MPADDAKPLYIHTRIVLVAYGVHRFIPELTGLSYSCAFILQQMKQQGQLQKEDRIM